MASREDVYQWISGQGAVPEYPQQIYRRNQKNNSTMTIINPATEEIIQEVKEDTEATVHEKYQQVKAGQFFWAARPVEERVRSEEHTSELQSHVKLVCRLLLEKKN